MSLKLLCLASFLVATLANPIASSARPSSSCTNIELIIARGTNEPGTYGQIVGDPLYAASIAKFGSSVSVSGYAVNYPASLACNSESLGVTDVVHHIVGQATKCPAQVFALVGYSQGADLMHNATIQLAASHPKIRPRVVAITLFGDPGNRGPNIASPLGGITKPFPAAYAKKVKQNCAHGDPICSFSGANIYAHLSYSSQGTNFIADSADFIVNQYQTHGNSGPSLASFGRPGADPATSPTPENVAAITSIGQFLGVSGAPLVAC